MATNTESQRRADSALHIAEAPVVPQRLTERMGISLRSFRCRPMRGRWSSCCGSYSNRIGTSWSLGRSLKEAAWEFQAPHAPTHVGVLDGYLTVAFGASHFHLCIGPTHGPRHSPTPEALAQHRRCARAELYRRLDRGGAPTSWGLRLWNGHEEQQGTIVFRILSCLPTARRSYRNPTGHGSRYGTKCGHAIQACKALIPSIDPGLASVTTDRACRRRLLHEERRLESRQKSRLTAGYVFTNSDLISTPHLKSTRPMVSMAAAPLPEGNSSLDVLPRGLSSNTLGRHVGLRQQSIDSPNGIVAEPNLPAADEMDHCHKYLPIVRGHFAYCLNDI